MTDEKVGTSVITRGNPNWGKPRPNEVDPVVPTAFEQIVTELALQPENYLSSAPLREWAQQNRHSKYVPEALLAQWGFALHLNY